MMKHSIKRQMITVFIGLLASMVLLLLIINVSLLEPYYISNKETQFRDMYEKLSQCMDKGTMEDKEVSVKMIHLAEKNNICLLYTSPRIFRRLGHRLQTGGALRFQSFEGMEELMKLLKSAACH